MPSKTPLNAAGTHFQAADFSQQLWQELARCLGQWYGPQAELAVGARGPRRLRQSFQWRFEGRLPEGLVCTLLVKIPRPLDGPEPLADVLKAAPLQAAAQQEFGALKLTAECPALHDDAVFLRLRPLGYLPRFNAIVTEALAARPLPRLLGPGLAFGRRAAWQDLALVVGRAARWLGLFHQHLGETEARDDWAPAFWAEVERECGLLERYLGARGGLAALRGRFRAVLAGLAGRPLPVAWLHGDFSAANVLVDRDQRVAVIDIARRRRGPVYVDLAMLLITLTNRRTQVMSHGAWLAWPSVQALWDTALRAYSVAGDCDPQLVYLFASLATLHLWREDEAVLARAAGLARPVAALGGRMMRRYLRGTVARYLERATVMPTVGNDHGH